MKVTHLLVPAAALMLASSVTMGSMYITISAAVSQSDAVTVEGEQADAGQPESDQLESDSSPTEAGVNDSETAPASFPEAAGPSPQDSLSQPVVEDSSTAAKTTVGVESSASSSQLSPLEMYVSEDGVVNGRLKQVGDSAQNDVPVPGAKVLFLSQSRPPQSAVADAEGQFRVSGIESGIYTVCVSSEGAIAAFAVRVIQDKTGGNLPAEINLSVATVYSGDVQEARRIVAEQNRNPRYQSILAAADSTAAAILASRRARTAAELSAERVFIDSTGAFDGEIFLVDPVTFLRKPVSDLKVFCITDGRVREPVTVGSDGSFRVSGLSEGPCSLVAAGTDGVMALGVYLTTNPALAGDTGSVNAEYSPVSLRRAQGPAFRGMVEANAAPGTPGEGATPGDDVTIVPDAAPFGGGGGFPGGGTGAGAAGGGGGFGAGGGLGGLLAAGAAGAIGFAIADNNNNPPATP